MPTLPRHQLILIAALLGATCLALLAAYLMFFRSAMIPAYQNIRQSDASAIVAELDKAGIPYRLANDGHDVLVPEDRASEARVAVAGSDIAVGGTVGFELFDNSDMGLTEFAQKINFQRAMQGELARTIMAMQGVEFARVHLAFPERSIFRANQGEPTAAVTVQMMRGAALGPRRIEGIQQLIASAVPGMSVAAVSVLDDKGDLVSSSPPAQGAYGAPLDERGALAQYYEVRATDAVRDAAPGLRFDVTVNPQAVDGAAGAVGALDGSMEPRATPERADLRLAVEIRAAQAIAPDVQQRIAAAVGDRLALDLDRGETIRFTVGPVGLAYRPPAQPAAAAPLPGVGEPESRLDDWWSGWGWRPWALLLLVGAILLLALRPRRRLAEAEILSFAEQLKQPVNDREDRHGEG